MKSMNFEELKKKEWDRYNKAHDVFDGALFRFNEAADDNFYTKLAELRVIMDCSKSMYGALKSLINIYLEIDNGRFTGIYVKNDKEALDDYRAKVSGVCEGE